jgi:serine/threonine protein kinase
MNHYQDGERIAGRYEVVGSPMQGGMGLVYVCLDLEYRRPVALKTFKPEYLPNRESRDRFLREGTVWVNLGYHPHIVRCHRVEYEDPSVYLVLELIAREANHSGTSLRDWMIPCQGLGVELSLLYALQIVRGMRHACEKIPGFVHRDLKPENLLVGAERFGSTPAHRLRVTDFGLVSALSDSEAADEAEEDHPGRTHLTKGIMGTPYYMAPEQWKMEPTGVYTDVYALGCILYEMLSGERVVSGGTIGKLKAEHCQEKRIILADCPEGVTVLLQSCLVLDPAKRYQSWEELDKEIEAIHARIYTQPLPQLEVDGGHSREAQASEGWSYNAMGMSYEDMGKVRMAIEYYEKALVAGRQAEEQQLEGSALGNLGNAYRSLDEAQRAISYYERCLTIHRELSDRSGEGADLGNLGAAYYLLGEVQKAIGYYEQSLAIN